MNQLRPLKSGKGGGVGGAEWDHITSLHFHKFKTLKIHQSNSTENKVM